MIHSRHQFSACHDSPFWQTRVVEVARKELAVRHAIIAVGASHEILLAGPDGGSLPRWLNTHFALEQYNKAIRCLVDHNGTTTDPALLLTTCILFTCCEGLRGNCQQAIIHTTQGFGILQQLADHSQSLRMSEYAVELYELYLRIRSSRLRCRNMTESKWDVFDHPLEGPQSTPCAFDAAPNQGQLILILDQCAAVLLGLESNANRHEFTGAQTKMPLQLVQRLANWESKCDNTFDEHKSPNPFGSVEHKLALTIKAHRILANIMIKVDLSDGPQCWNSFQKDFITIVELAESLLGPSQEIGRLTLSTKEHTETNEVPFPLELLPEGMDVTRPLIEVCARCSDAAIKRKALKLLANHPQPAWMKSPEITEAIGRSFLQPSKDSLLVFGGSYYMHSNDTQARGRSFEPEDILEDCQEALGGFESTATTMNRR